MLAGSPLFDTAEARSFKGGRSFKKSTPTYQKAPQQKQQAPANQKQGGLGRGLAGGLLGGAIGALLFGSLFGMGGEGFGLLPILVLGIAGFMIWRMLSQRSMAHSGGGHHDSPSYSDVHTDFDIGGGAPKTTDHTGEASVEQGLAEIRRTDPGFSGERVLTADVVGNIYGGHE